MGSILHQAATCGRGRPVPSLKHCSSRMFRFSPLLCRPWGSRSVSVSARGTFGDGRSPLLRISEEVRDALATNKPVVALESTIYTHGAFDEDLGLEAVVRKHGSVPAVIGVFHGVPTVGLTPEEVRSMVQDGTAAKVSRRDLAYLVGMGALGRKLHGGTTIAGTMILARLAGIRVFGTGGLGGVHRGGEDSLDISADLTELGRTRVAVVSSGCKGFLDIPRTLEFLETQGTAVATFADGRSGAVDFPAFWARESGSRSPSVVQDETEAAAMILAQERLGIETGLLFANAIPEEFSIARSEMDTVIETAVREASEKGFRGSANTPYILNRIRELTQGRSVTANLALVRSNVARASKIAVVLSDMLDGSKGQLGDEKTSVFTRENHGEVTKEKPAAPKIDVLVAGSVALDLSCDFIGGSTTPAMHTSNPSSITQSIGGVGHNVALAVHRVGQQVGVRLCSLVGDDASGNTVLSSLEATGLDTTYVRQLSHEYHASSRTAQYVAVNDANKNLVVGMADMAIFTNHSFPKYWQSAVAGAQPKWLVVDGNWSQKDIRAWISAAKENKCSVAFEPVSTAKSTRLFSREQDGGFLETFPRAGIDIAAPNHFELNAMFHAAKENGYFDHPAWFSVIDAFGMQGAREQFVRSTSAEMTDAGIPVQTVQLLPYIPTILTKLGPKGVLLTTILRPGDPRLRDLNSERYIVCRSLVGHPHIGGIYMRLFPATEQVENVVSVNGVGDTFLGVIAAGLALGGKVENLIDVAQKGAVLTLKSHEAVSPSLGLLGKELEEAVAR